MSPITTMTTVNYAALVVILSSVVAAMSRKSLHVSQGTLKYTSHHRTGIDCSPAALKREFPSLYNNSWNSAGPESIDVTTVCRADADADGVMKPDLQIEWNPPRHNGAVGIRGFEVMMEGPTSISYIQCRIVVLETTLNEKDSQMAFNETMSVASHQHVVVTVHSLPKVESKYSKEHLVITPACDSGALSAATWYPTVINIEYRRSRQLRVKFQPPPAVYGFEWYKIGLFNDTDLWYHQEVINETHYTFQDIQPNRYYLTVEPMDYDWTDSKLCKCRTDDDQSCGFCTQTQTRTFTLTAPPEMTTTTTTGSPQVARTKTEPNEPLNVPLIVAIGIPCLFVMFGILLLLTLAHRRRRRYSKYSTAMKGLSTPALEDDSSKIPTILLLEVNAKASSVLAEILAKLLRTAFCGFAKVQFDTESDDSCSSDSAVLPIHIMSMSTEVKCGYPPESLKITTDHLDSRAVSVTFGIRRAYSLYNGVSDCYWLPEQLAELVSRVETEFRNRSFRIDRGRFESCCQDSQFIALRKDLQLAVNQEYASLDRCRDMNFLSVPMLTRERFVSNSSSQTDSGVTMDRTSSNQDFSLNADMSDNRDQHTPEDRSFHCGTPVFITESQPFLRCPDDVSFLAPSEIADSVEEVPVSRDALHNSGGCTHARCKRHLHSDCSSCSADINCDGSSVVDPFIHRQMSEINKRYEYIVAHQNRCGDVSSIFNADA